MNRRDMIKTVAGVVVGGPAALELAAVARDDALRQELMDGYFHTQPANTTFPFPVCKRMRWVIDDDTRWIRWVPDNVSTPGWRDMTAADWETRKS